VKGTKIELPLGYAGLVLTDASDANSESEERRDLTVVGRFDSLTYWNLDQVPSANDKIVQVSAKS